MTTAADWIKVVLTDAEVAQAEHVGKLQADYAQSRGFKAKGLGSQETHALGWKGELAVARYEGVPRDADWTWEGDIRRGYDVAGWQVRTSSRIQLGLGMNAGDTGRFLLVFGHEAPVMYLAGWIEAADAFRLAESRKGPNGKVWYRVDPKHLLALPEKNGFAPKPQGWLVDPEAAFYCEVCHGTHAIIDHRKCRAVS